MIISLIKNKYCDKELLAKVIIYSAITLMVLDTIYMNVMGIAYGHKEECVIYNFLPQWAFFIYEHIIELFMVVLLGIFGGVLIEQYTKKIKRFFPRNQLLAFLYASFLPVCSCGVIPVVESMKERVSIKTLVTFIIAAPLLNPYIVFMSFTILGVKYAFIRIVASLFLAVFSGWIVEVVARKFHLKMNGVYDNCNTGCEVKVLSPYRKTMVYMKRILPYVFIAGALTVLFEIFQPQRFLESFSFANEPFSSAIMMLVGIPIYVCNGADVLFLKPFLVYTDLSIASAMSFSMASSAVCISSIVMLVKFFGKKMTMVLLASMIINIAIIVVGIYMVF